MKVLELSKIEQEMCNVKLEKSHPNSLWASMGKDVTIIRVSGLSKSVCNFVKLILNQAEFTTSPKIAITTYCTSAQT